MNTNAPSFRSHLGRVRGLGSAKNGTHHWLAQRITAAVMIPLTLVLVASFIQHVVLGDYTTALLWMHSPLGGAFVVFFLLTGFYHALLGLQVVIEDYVHTEFLKISCLTCLKFFAGLFLILGLIAVIRVQLMDISNHV